MSFVSYLDEHSDISDLLFHAPAKYRSLSRFTDEILRGKSEYTVAQRETMAAFVSGLNGCHYCYGAHAAVAAEFGVDAEFLEILLENIDAAPIEENLKPVFHFIRKLTLTPSKIVAKDASRVFDAGWTDDALSDAVHVCALFCFYNRLTDGHGLKGNDAQFQKGANHLSKRGYRLPFFARWIKHFL